MDFSKIISVSGKPGLYELTAQSRSSIIVKSLDDGSKTAISNAHRVSTLADITIYTDGGDVPLEEVFKKFHEKQGAQPIDVDVKDPEALQEYLFSVLPEYDEDRVYTSDIRKMVKWYNLIVKFYPDAFTADEESTEEASETTAEENTSRDGGESESDAVGAETEKGEKKE